MDFKDTDGDIVGVTMGDNEVVIAIETDEDVTYSGLLPDTARAIALALIRLADEIEPRQKTEVKDLGFILLCHGKRYLTRDWKVVRYDGSQDVVARVYTHKPGRFKDDEEVWAVSQRGYKEWIIDHCVGSTYLTDNNILMVRVSDLPDDMKGGPKS